MVDPDQAKRPERRAQEIALAGAAVPAVVAFAVLIAFSWIVALVALVVVGAGAYAWLTRGGEGLALRGLDARPADPVADARLINLVDGLCTAAGVRPPRLLVTGDATCNLLVVGRRREQATLVVTRGLLEHLSRIQLEGILAEGLVQVRQGDVVPATVAVATFGLAARLAVGDGARDGAVDQAAASLTHYPPALAQALDTMAEHGTGVPAARAATAHLWLADPLPGAGRRARAPLAERAAALREL
jgi:hypothetical protein